MSKVSVIIPVYNGKEYLDECIMSVLGQTMTDIDVIVVDDDSTDGSYELLQQYAEKDSRMTVVRQNHLGAGAARNLGMEYARGEYLSFLDADDFFEPDMLEKAYKKAVETDADIAVFESDYYSNINKIYIPNYFAVNYDLIRDRDVFSSQDIEKNVFRVFTGWAWDKLFRTEFVKKYQLSFQNLRTTNDMLFVFTAQILAQRIAMERSVLAHHRLTSHTLSVTREKSWHCFYEALTALKENLEKYNLYDRFEQDYINYCVHFSLWHLRTLKMPAQEQLYTKLRDEWYDAMAVTAYPSRYFYNKKEYNEYRNVYRYEYGKLPCTQKIKFRILQVAELMVRLCSVLRHRGPVAAVRWIILMKIKIGKQIIK